MKKGDVLFGKRRAYQKKVAIAPFDGIFSAHGMVLRPNVDVIDEDFFPLFISSDYFLDTAIKISVGSLSPTINWKDLKEIEFELPKLDFQKELAIILWSIIDTIDAYKDLINQTDNMIKSQFYEIMNNRTLKCKLSDYCESDISKTKGIFDKNELIKYIEISSIDSELNIITNPTELVFGSAPTSAKYMLKPNDVLVSLVRPNLKKIAINEYKANNIVGTNGFCVLRPKLGVSQYFLKACVLSDLFTNKMISVQTGSTYPTIKNQNVLDFEVPLLTSDEIVKISSLVKVGDLSKLKLNKSLIELQSLYNRIVFEFLNKKEDN